MRGFVPQRFGKHFTVGALKKFEIARDSIDGVVCTCGLSIDRIGVSQCAVLAPGPYRPRQCGEEAAQRVCLLQHNLVPGI